MLQELVPIVRKLTERCDLTAEEAEKAFVLLEREDETSFFYFALLAALHTKGETAEELLGFCRANAVFVPPFELGPNVTDTVDVSGTGGDRIKTGNVSTAAAFVVASAGIPVVKQAFFAVTGVSGSADVMMAFGADPLGMSREGEARLRGVFEQAGMLVYHANSMARPEERKGYFRFWLENVPKSGLSFVTAYHLAANVYSPIAMKRRVYGVFDQKYVKGLAEVFRALGYEKAMVVNGRDGLDEVSTVGTTVVCDLEGGVIREYEVVPEELGLRRSSVEEIRGGTREDNIRDFVRVLSGIEKGAKRDLVVANGGAGLYVSGKAASLGEGVKLAGALVDQGKAWEKLEAYVRICGDPGLLEKRRMEAAA